MRSGAVNAHVLSFGAAVPPTWNPDQDDALVVRRIRQETADVKTFVLAPDAPTRFAYEPGQFVTFEFEIDGARINRCYTLSSSPTRPGAVSITVKRVPGGPVSNYLHDRIAPGETLRAVGPMGDFTCARRPGQKYLFLSGGSGITPVMSMARAHFDLATGADIVFVHSARTPADIIFRRELEHMAASEPAFRFAAICEADAPFEPWHGLLGRLSRAHLEAVAPDFRKREVYVCGPGPYMAGVRDLLREAGFDMDRHHEESFVFAELAAGELETPAEAVPHVAAARTFKVKFRKSGRVIDCPADMYVLEAARRAGLRLPSSCTKGLCGTCKSKLVEGAVDMKHGGGIRQREIDAGMVLICCSKPTNDLVIER
jgi:ferredoxin-NADP reductase